MGCTETVAHDPPALRATSPAGAREEHDSGS